MQARRTEHRFDVNPPVDLRLLLGHSTEHGHYTKERQKKALNAQFV